MHILLLGTGYVGSHLITHWQDTEDRFFAFTTTLQKLSSLQSLPGVEKAFLAKSKTLSQALNSCPAVIIAVAPKKNASYETTYLDTARQFKTLCQGRTTPLYLIYTSSTAVYGNQTGKWVSEENRPNPSSENGKILLETEKTYLSLQSATTLVCILRLAGIYGPERTLSERARSFSGATVPGSKDMPTNHAHISDITRAIEFCIKQQLVGIYNVVSDSHPTREELYNTLCAQQELPPPKWNANLPTRHGSNHCVSNNKIKESGFTFLYDVNF